MFLREEEEETQKTDKTELRPQVSSLTIPEDKSHVLFLRLPKNNNSETKANQ